MKTLRWHLYHFKLKLIVRFIKKHKLYPVYLDKDLLEVWSKTP